MDAEAGAVSGSPLAKISGNRFPWKRANTLEFVNPNESLPAVIGFLSAAPRDFNIPIVFNDNMYGSEGAYGVADGIADVDPPHLRYWSERCAMRLSNAPRYQGAVKCALEAMVRQRAFIIVRDGPAGPFRVLPWACPGVVVPLQGQSLGLHP